MAVIAQRLGVRPPEFRARRHDETLVPMRDGTRLRTRRIGPNDAGPHPTVLIRTPYGIGWTPPLFLVPLISGFLARRGYQVVLQDTRGRYGSEGRFYPFVHEAEDGRDTLEWISNQSWFDGRLGMWGASYFGYTQWAVSADPPPFLKAIVPVVTSTDFYTLFYPGGAFSLISALRWAAGNGEKKGRRAPERRLPAASRARPMRAATQAAGRHATFFDDWVDHPQLDEYWQGINHPSALEGRVPALLIAGTYDIFCGPQLADFAALDESACLDLGPTAHGSYAIPARKLGWKQAGMLRSLASSLYFLDHHLQGRPLERTRVQHYLQGEDRWLQEPAWPPPDVHTERFHLRSGGHLTRETPGGGEQPDRYRYDPADPVPTRGGTFLGPKCGPEDQRPLENHPQVLCYDTAPLSEPLELAGPVRLHLRVSSEGSATDFTGKLVHVPGDVSRPALNLCEGITRVDRMAGEAAPVEVDLWHVSARLAAGDRLRLEVSSSNFPRFDAHPNVPGPTGQAREVRAVQQTIHHARDAISYLELPVR